MTPPDVSTADTPRDEAVARSANPTSRDGAGRRPTRWGVVAAKEFADTLLSARFFVLLVITALAGVAAVSSAASALHDSAPDATATPSPFLLLFTAAPSDIPSFVSLIGFLGPLLGIAFAFDAISSERSGRTLPRLVSQPVYRDDIINGKFVAGLAAVALALTVTVAVVAGLGIVRLGITPSPDDLARLLVYLVLAVVYVGLWMAFALLCSVTMRRAATSALVAIAVWLTLVLFGMLLAGLVADLISPVDAAGSVASQVSHLHTQRAISLISPYNLYQEATSVLLDPQVRAVGVVLRQQVDRAVPGTLPLGQSLLVVWPQIVALIAANVVIFALAYLAFLRQEVRA